METVGGIPVECLSGELAGVWSGWRILSDREIVREASVKGRNISLAQKCLAFRRRCPLSDVQAYFQREVEIWVEELLSKQQVHRATHILNNVGKDPKEYIGSICLKGKEPKLRDYLVQHLIRIKGFEPTHMEAWEMINLVNKYGLKHSIQDEQIFRKSIEEIMQIPDDTKNVLYTDLYFHTFDPDIVDKLQSDVVWNYLLSNNNIDLLGLWIDTNYAPDVVDREWVDREAFEKIRRVFEKLNITVEMIERIGNSDAATIVKELVLSHLSRYGVFTKKEQLSTGLTLSRLFSNKIMPSEFDKILLLVSCNINAQDFMRKINIRLHSKAYLEENQIQEIDVKNIELFNALNDMCITQKTDSFEKAILNTITYVSSDMNEYLLHNHSIAFVLIFLQCKKQLGALIESEHSSSIEQRKLEEIFTSEEDLKTNDAMITKEVLRNTLDSLPVLKQIVDNECKDESTTVYQLLNGYQRLDATQAFKWRQKTGEMPDFSNDYLVAKHGRREKLTYINYLKESRPNTAARVLRRQQNKFHDGISLKMKSQASIDAHIFGLRNLNNPEITSTCVSFIEMVGVDSENLRLHLTVAEYIRKELNLSIGNLLESVLYRNSKDLKTVISLLERSFHGCLKKNIISDTTEFISTLKEWDILVRFARSHNAPLPGVLLEYLAKNGSCFEFLLVGQIFAHPMNQILEIAKQFPNRNVHEHLFVSLNNPHLLRVPSSSSTDWKLKSRDSRKVLYSKIGLKQNESAGSSPSGSTDTTSSAESYTSAFENIPSTFENCQFSNDLWMTILKCHQSQDPPGTLLNASRSNMSPLLIVLATCYEPSSVAAYWCSWLVISTNNQEFISEYEDCLEQQIWSAGKVLELLKNMVALGYVNSISRSLKIFMPENPLCPFMEFLAQSINMGAFEKSRSYLQAFKTSCSSQKCNRKISWDETGQSYLWNAYWITSAAIKCTMVAFRKSFQSAKAQIQFLEVLCECNFNVDLPVDAPNFHRLLEFIKILSKTHVTPDFSAFDTTDDSSTFVSEIQRCISELVRCENYNSALQLCNSARMNCSDIIIAQWRNEFNRSVHKDGKVASDFWKSCAFDFEKYYVSYEQAAQFYVEHAERVTSHRERYQILKQALEILQNGRTDCRTIATVEMAMWKSCILAGPEDVEIESTSNLFNKLKTELIFSLDELQVSCELTEPAEIIAVEQLINKLLDAGDLGAALRIASLFNYKHEDLQILMLCLSLAEGEISPYQLTAQQRMLLSKTNRNIRQRHSTYRSRGLQRISSLSSLNHNQTNQTVGSNTEVPETAAPVAPVAEEQDKIDCTLLLGTLVKILRHGTNVGRRVLLCYTLATHLGKSYQSLLTLTDAMQFLHEVIQNDCYCKLEVISDIISAYCIENRQVAEFLAEKIVANITRLIEDGNDQVMAIWGYPLDANFHLIIELCSEPSLLGFNLLEAATTLLGRSHGERRDVSSLKIIVELLIKSHDCFTASCHMEGIASILRKSHLLANSLQNLKQWGLLVRLLTGVGRFTEMNYIFQMLKENGQFECLLGKGLDKIPGLRMALLDFLKRHCPEDKELFTLVALRFLLHSEIASMRESEAKKIIKELIPDAQKEFRSIGHPMHGEVRLTKNEQTEKLLHQAMVKFTDATEFYLQDDKLNLGYQCSHQAELVALQITLTNSVSNGQQVVRVLNLDSTDISKIICNHLSFQQANILARAYNHHVDWASAVYSHCVLSGESKYLKDFVGANMLSVAIVEECARRFQLEKTITKQMTENMQTLVSLLADLGCKYTLASQLGFKKIIETMLGNSVISAYLKDTVWRKGYSSSAFK